MNEADETNTGENFQIAAQRKHPLRDWIQLTPIPRLFASDKFNESMNSESKLTDQATLENISLLNKEILKALVIVFVSFRAYL